MATLPGVGVATVTGITGPAETVTSLAFTGITRINFNIINRVCSIFYGSNQVFELDYAGTVTVTDTISGTKSTFVMST